MGLELAPFGAAIRRHLLPGVASISSVPLPKPIRESRRADSNRLHLLQLRVCGQWLLDVAGVCKFGISKGFSVPCIAHYCRVLRPG